MESLDQSNTPKIATVENTVCFGSNKFINIIFENKKIFCILKVTVQVVLLSDRGRNERILIKVVPDIKKWDIVSISCNI